MIQYVTGDVTSPLGEGERIVAHVCNDEGKWGRGVSGAIGRRWPAAEGAFRGWKTARLGSIQIVRVADDVIVMNMIAQHGIRRPQDAGPAPIRYEALGTCLEKLAREAIKRKASVHGPRFGAGLSGGDWRVIEPMIEQLLCSRGVPVTIYDFEASR